MADSGLASIFNSLKSNGRAQSKPIDETKKLKPSVPFSALGKEQKEVYDFIENSSQTTFVTGKAGTGKSYLLDFFCANTVKKAVVLAPTGVAAIKVGGQTIHSFFRIPPKSPIDKKEIIPRGNKKELYKALEVVIIDEISMVRADVMDAIDFILKSANETDLPFGGKQLILFGDLYQLPPIANPQEKRYLDDNFGGSFFYYAPAVQASGMAVMELGHVFRQKDKTFINILNQVRDGDISDENLRILNKRSEQIVEEDPAVLIAPRNDAVSRINEAMLERLAGDVYEYDAVITGDFKENEFPTEQKLRLKIGARVMMLKNDFDTSSDRRCEKARWVNGTLGQISKLSEDSIWVMINNVEHRIDRAVWVKQQYSYDSKTKKLEPRTSASFNQFPVRLSWAITVHKAQGATYQSVGIDLGDGMFAEGQTYVALSRCVSLDKLYLTRPLERTDILTSNEVKRFMKENTV